MNKTYIYSDQFNVMIIGDDKVGKTSILKNIVTFQKKKTQKLNLIEQKTIIKNLNIIAIHIYFICGIRYQKINLIQYQKNFIKKQIV